MGYNRAMWYSNWPLYFAMQVVRSKAKQPMAGISLLTFFKLVSMLESLLL